MYEKTIEVAGQKVLVRELTVKDLRGWLIDFRNKAIAGLDGDGEIFSVDRDLFSDFSVDELFRFTDLTDEKIEDMRPSDLRKVIEAVKELNPDFFAMWGRMSQNALSLIDFLNKNSKTLNGQPAPSSSTAISTSGATH